MRWRVKQNGIFRGTLRIARFEFDTERNTRFCDEIYHEMESRLNAKSNDAAIHALSLALPELEFVARCYGIERLANLARQIRQNTGLADPQLAEEND